jgi:hypothetical protein
MTPENPAILRTKDWCLIGILWLTTQLLILVFLGINDRQEALKYISWSNDWLSGIRSFPLNVIFYSGYIAIHVLLRLAGLPVNSMYVFQLALSALSVYYFVRILSFWVRSGPVLIFSAILYATCLIIQQYVSFLYTDSVFCNLLLIATYFLLVEERGPRQKITFWILLILLPFFRPVGFLFSLLACLYWLSAGSRNKGIKILVCVAYISFIGFLIHKSFAESPNFYYPLHNIDANVICGYPGDLLQYEKVPYREGMGVFNYFFHNPGMAIRLFSYRLFNVFSMTRPYFSRDHNLSLLFPTLLYCGLGLTGLFHIFRRKNKREYLLAAGILVFSIPGVVFCDDWSGRFSMPVYCFVLLAAGIGAEIIYQKFISRPPNPPAAQT